MIGGNKMEINKQYLVMHYRKIIQNKSNPGSIRENARREFLKLLEEKENEKTKR